MRTDTNVKPVGTGQQGAATPAGAKKDIPSHIEGQHPANKVEETANRAARKGVERQHREDPSVFTK